MKKIHLVLVICLVSLQCTDSKDTAFTEGNTVVDSRKLEAVFDREMIFEIDSTFAVDRIYGIFPFEDKNEAFLAFYSSKKIFIYRPDTKDLHKTLTLKREGPNAVGPASQFNGLIIENLDSHYFLNHLTSTIYHVDGNGEVTTKIKVPVDESRMAIFGNNHYHPFLKNNELHLPVYGFKGAADWTKIPACIVFDTKKNTAEEVFPYPDLYNNAYWGYHPFMRWPSVSYDSKRERFLVSFSVDPEVHVYDSKYQLQEKIPLVSDFSPEVTPQDEDPDRRLNKEGRDGPGNSAYFLRTSFYFGSYYHDKLNCYFRLIRIGKDESIGRDQVKFSLVIGDERLRKVGEYLLPPSYPYGTFFPTDDGIAFFNLDKFSAAEDKMVFDVMKFRYVEN